MVCAPLSRCEDAESNLGQRLRSLLGSAIISTEDVRQAVLALAIDPASLESGNPHRNVIAETETSSEYADEVELNSSVRLVPLPAHSDLFDLYGHEEEEWDAETSPVLCAQLCVRVRPEMRVYAHLALAGL